MNRLLLRVLAWPVLAISFGGTLALARVLRARRWRGPASGRILVTGTFYNGGWFLSHLEPLARCGASEVIVVTDVPQTVLDRVTVLCPSIRAVRVLGRAGAKLLLMWRAGRCRQPDLYMGYHLFPGALSALVIARLRGRPAAYQMTGGPIEVLGGGYSNENVLMSALGRPSRFLEKLAVCVVREFDLVVVRGQHARRFLAASGVDRNIAVITGSIRPHDGALASRTVDMIFVGRLAPIKQADQFVKIVARLAGSRPRFRAVMVGAGPELVSLRREAERLGVGDNIEFLGHRDDVSEFLRQSKVFVLTSRSEGMSIALLEAMGCGVPPVAADVGELSDVVISGVNGWLVRPNDLDEYVKRITELLDDPGYWQRLSNSARDRVTELSGVESVARRWRECLTRFSEVPEQATS
jgi:glycosyltransferase involved in cell wall biosynthesis